MHSRHGAALYLRAEPSVVWVTHQTISQQLPLVLSKIFIPSLLLAVLPSEPSCCFTCFPCWLTHVISFIFPGPSRMSLAYYFFAAAPLADAAPPASSFFPEEVPPSELNEIYWSWKSESLKVFSFLSLPLSHALFLIPAWLKRTMTALDVMLWRWMVSKRISYKIEIWANMWSAPQLQRLSDNQPCSK